MLCRSRNSLEIAGTFPETLRLLQLVTCLLKCDCILNHPFKHIPIHHSKLISWVKDRPNALMVADELAKDVASAEACTFTRDTERGKEEIDAQKGSFKTISQVGQAKVILLLKKSEKGQRYLNILL